ncbi:uncharacterized protein BJX67DRAFT_226989 [Aspergillus lucknowensis]|uniref:Uncharacterized protein n=1 Tax=Aspergillus lucknowensis TaxID=176173 RepID=A0ABR4LL96_9EURO
MMRPLSKRHGTRPRQEECRLEGGRGAGTRHAGDRGRGRSRTWHGDRPRGLLGKSRPWFPLEESIKSSQGGCSGRFAETSSRLTENPSSWINAAVQHETQAARFSNILFQSVNFQVERPFMNRKKKVGLSETLRTRLDSSPSDRTHADSWLEPANRKRQSAPANLKSTNVRCLSFQPKSSN